MFNLRLHLTNSNPIEFFTPYVFMNNSNRNIVAHSMAISVAIGAILSLYLSYGGDLVGALLGFLLPPGYGFPIWKSVAIIAFAAIYGLFAEKSYFKSFAAITIILMIAWFSFSVLAHRVFNIDLLFVPVLICSILILITIQLKKYWKIDLVLNEKLISLASSGYLLRGKDADTRMKSGLKLLRTVLPLSEVIVFQYESNGELNPIGRTRNSSVHESLSSRQNSWRENVAQCEKALRSRETVIETDARREGAVKLALPLITENVLVGGLFVNIRENFEENDVHLLEGFSEQLARNFQRMQLETESVDRKFFSSFLSTQAIENRLNITNLINGLIKEQSFGVVATSYIQEAHAIAYLDGTIAYVNRQMRHLAKIEPGEINELNVFDLLNRFKTDVFNEPSVAIRRVLQTGSTFQKELLFDEDVICLDLEIKLVKIATDVENVHETEIPKKPACFLISLRDITTRKENKKLRSDMVNLMSHELRTPITSIQGFAEMLMADEKIPEDAREYLDIIANESQRAANLLSNFLSVANLQQSDKQEFHKSPVRVCKVVEEVVENLKGKAKQKRIRLVDKRGEHIPPIAADRGLLTKAILHLVDNAVKYSPERSSVIISTILESDFLRVEVEDRGYGIPPAEQEKIWNKFYRVARDGRDKEEESTGLGLSLVKEIVEQHSGTVAVESEVGRGSKFSFKIPRF